LGDVYKRQGINRYVTGEEARPKQFRVDPEVERRAAERLAALRMRREEARVERSLGRLETAARGRESLMPALRDCVRSYATIGEICGRLRSVFGSYRDAGIL
ncbi:MAG: methylmalonyl-CoA mutase family protein, partial [Candidatus Eisenbacteria bacterium]|nr:methylmalonyl-CoA mutase family protein [Candidatus Eisenbacteria bacterium]